MSIIPNTIPITRQQLKQEKYEKKYSAADTGSFKKWFYENVRFRRFGKMKKNENASLVKENETLKAAVAQAKDASETKNKFLAIIGHDLRSPFHAILSFSDLLAEGGMDEGETKEFAERLNDAVKNVYGLLNNLQEWSMMQSGKLEAKHSNFDMMNVIRETGNLFANAMVKKGLKQLAFEMGKMDTQVYADKNMASSIIRNLLANAIKFTASGGTITVSAFEAKNGFCGFAVKDSGRGMTEEQIMKLFNPSIISSTNGTDGEKGTGLGLQLVKEFVEKNGGKVWVESEVGKGTTFYFTLRAKKGERATTEAI